MQRWSRGKGGPHKGCLSPPYFCRLYIIHILQVNSCVYIIGQDTFPSSDFSIFNTQPLSSSVTLIHRTLSLACARCFRAQIAHLLVTKQPLGS